MDHLAISKQPLTHHTDVLVLVQVRDDISRHVALHRQVGHLPHQRCVVVVWVGIIGFFVEHVQFVFEELVVQVEGVPCAVQRLRVRRRRKK